MKITEVSASAAAPADQNATGELSGPIPATPRYASR